MRASDKPKNGHLYAIIRVDETSDIWLVYRRAYGRPDYDLEQLNGHQCIYWTSSQQIYRLQCQFVLIFIIGIMRQDISKVLGCAQRGLIKLKEAVLTDIGSNFGCPYHLHLLQYLSSHLSKQALNGRNVVPHTAYFGEQASIYQSIQD